MAVAGCVGPQDDDTNPTDSPPKQVPTPTDELDIQNPTPADDSTLTSWEADLDCQNGTDESYHAQKREVSIQSVKDEIGSEYNPVPYAELTDAQKEILALVIEHGGFATCESNDAFNSFLDVAVNEYAREQEADAMNVYLEYDGRYYKLYIQKQDQIYAYWIRNRKTY